MVSIGNIAATLSLNTRPFDRAVGRTEKKARRFRKSLNRYLTVGLIAVATALVTTGKAFAEFEEAMRNVNTIAKQNEQQFQKTTSAVLELSREFGRMPVTLAAALYDINSASFQAAKGLEVLRAATVAGRAGLSTTQEAARAITGALNAYGMSAQQAMDVSDTMFKTVEHGVITFGQFAGSLGIAVSTGAAAKVPFDELSAAIATMTRGGINVREAFTALNRVMLRIIQNKGPLEKLFATTASGTGAAMLKARGLAGTMEFLEKVTEGDTEAMVALGFMVRDLKAALSLTRNEGRDYAKDIARIADKNKRAGATMAAFTEQTKSLSFAWDKLKTELKVAMILIGRTVSPALRAIITDVTKAIEKFNGMGEGLKKVQDKIVDLVLNLKLLKIGAKFVFKSIDEIITTWVANQILKFQGLIKYIKQASKAIKFGMKLAAGIPLTKEEEVTFKVLAKQKFEAPKLIEIGPILDKLTKEYEKEIADMMKKIEPPAKPTGRSVDIAMGKIIGIKPGLDWLGRSHEAMEDIAEQQKKIFTPAAMNIGAKTIEKGSIDAYRIERGLKDPSKKSLQEISRNTQLQNRLIERGIEIRNQKVVEFG